MGQGRGKLVRGAVAGLALLLVAAGVWGWFNRATLETRYAAYRLRSATSDEDRARYADKLVTGGEGSLPAVLGLVRAGDPTARAAVVAALERHLTAQPEGDSNAQLVCCQLLDIFAGCDEGGQEAVLELLPPILKHTGMTQAAKCREVVAAGVKLPGVGGRLAAIRAALHPAVHARAAVLPLLNADEPEVRTAALFAVGSPADDEPVIGDEELFRWLHDPDEGVRRVCNDVLVSRGRTDAEIALGRRLIHPDAAERLKLLLDLRYADDLADPEPWLERLSHDPDPGVRAGAARVVVELVASRRTPMPGWVGRLADADADATVRRIAGYYRAQSVVREDAGVRPAAGP